MKPFPIFANCCLLLGMGWSASAGITTYMDGAAFTNAANALVTYDLRPVSVSFEKLDGLLLGASWTVAGIDVEAPPPPPYTYVSGATFISQGGLFAESRHLAGQTVLGNLDSILPVTVSFSTPVYAFGTFLSSQLPLQQTSFTATVSLDTGDTFTFAAAGQPNSTFFGFTSSTPVRELTFSDGGVHPAGPMDPGVFWHEELIGSIFMVAEVPEPGSIALLGLGGAALLWRVWGRRGRAVELRVSARPTLSIEY